MALAVVGVLVLAMFGGLLVTLYHGPVSLPYLARAIEDRASTGNARLTVGAATIDLSEGLPLRIELENVAMDIGGGRPVSLSVPRISAPVDLSAALLGKLQLAEIVLDQARLKVSTLSESTSPTEIPDMSVLVEAADRTAGAALHQLAERGVARIELLAAEIVAEGEETYRIRGIDAVLTRSGQDDLNVSAEVAGRLGQWRAEVSRVTDPTSRERLMRVDLHDVSLGEFMPLEMTMGAGRGLGVPVRARLDATLNERGGFKETRVGFIVSPGWVNTGRSIVSFDKIDVQALWEAGSPGFKIAPSSYIRGNTYFPFEGVVEPPREWQDLWSYRIVSRNAEIGPSDVPGPPFAMEAFVVEGRADPAAREMHFDKILLRSGSANLDGAGSVRIGDDGPYLALAIESGPMSVATLKRLWPVTMIPPARAWIIEHLVDGRVNDGRATVALQPPAFDVSDPDPGWSGNDVNVDISFSDMSLKTVGTVPVAQSLSGRVRVVDEVLTVTSGNGVMVARSGEQISLPDVVFSVPDIRKSGDKTGVLELTASGPAPSLAALLDAEPFTVLSRNDLGPDDVDGTGEMTLNARFALVKDMRIDDVDWSLAGALRGFSNSKPIRGHKLGAGNLSFDVDARSIALKGKARLDGLPADLDIVVPFGDAGPDGVAARQGVTLDVTARQLADRGIDLRQFVNGSLRLSSEETAAGQTYDIDLTRARIDLAEVGWTKSPDVAARARFTMTENNGRREIRGFTLDSEGVEITGSINLTKSGDLESAQFSRFALRANDDASMRVSRDGRQIVVDFRAKRFDGRGLIASLTRARGGDGSGGNTALRLTADIEQLTGFNGVNLAGVKLNLSSAGGETRSLSVSGTSSGRAAFKLDLAGKGSERVLSGTIQDTGALLRFANLYERMRGGVGSLSVSMPSAKNWTGRFKIRRLAITEDPAIRELARARVVTETGDRRRQQLLAGAERSGEASFSALDLEFRRSGDILTITDGTLAGATVGGTVSGNVDLATRTLDMTGTFVPIFALNNLFAKIPILGFALGGGSDEGLIGVTYKLTGSIGDPVLTVNPASAMAPGIFRKIFEYR
ncbi:AsmA-like C-terminal domain-containing protein [Stappia sp.]|uniref:AsmA-like C-terminal domain-containing protein n=1 Tax=Stappia sp. TaxID=1870903 RepID=UPI003A995674